MVRRDRKVQRIYLAAGLVSPGQKSSEGWPACLKRANRPAEQAGFQDKADRSWPADSTAPLSGFQRVLSLPSAYRSLKIVSDLTATTRE